MTIEKPEQRQRQRAPSKRSLATRARILDAAEQLFAERGFEGASIRDIAALAGVQGALVNHHGGAKEDLFFTVVARRAEELSALRLQALEAARGAGPLTLRRVIAAFVDPYLHQTFHAGPQWLAYGRLVAHVSADERWRDIAARCFDPTAAVFVQELARLLPQTDPRAIGAGFVFMVSSMLSLRASGWRIDALAGQDGEGGSSELLLDYCEAGFRAISGA